MKIGQKIAEPGGFVSVPVHASVSGTVKEIVKKPNKICVDVTNIVIENDFQEEISEEVQPKGSFDPVSYTHLYVYKRQAYAAGQMVEKW